MGTMILRTILSIGVLALSGPGVSAAADARGAAHAVARALAEHRSRLEPRLHSTDFALEHLGCIVMPRAELRRWGYPGHAFACEEASAGQVLGAVLDRRGRRLCTIAGSYAGDDCYELTFCGTPERLCVHP